MRCVGIDYSLRCPAVSVIGDDLTFGNSRHYYLTNTKKYVGIFNNIKGYSHKPYLTEMQRYLGIASWAVYDTELKSDDIVFLEDYSMGSTGRIFSIAENTAILKYLLHYNSISYITVPPTTLKKHFQGKGNADKEKMYEAFVEKTGIALKCLFQTTAKVTNPISDICDAFALGLYGHDYIRNSNQNSSNST